MKLSLVSLSTTSLHGLMLVRDSKSRCTSDSTLTVTCYTYVCMCMCACVYICAFFCSECCVHLGTGVLGTSAWAGVYITQVFFLHQRTHLQTRSLQVVHICVYVYMCV